MRVPTTTPTVVRTVDQFNLVQLGLRWWWTAPGWKGREYTSESNAMSGLRKARHLKAVAEFEDYARHLAGDYYAARAPGFKPTKAGLRELTADYLNSDLVRGPVYNALTFELQRRVIQAAEVPSP